MPLFSPPPSRIAPGAVHLPGLLSPDRQARLAAACRRWAVPLRRVRLPSGGVMSVRQACLGWEWTPYRYRRHHRDGGPVAAFPAALGRLAVECVAAAYGTAGDFTPDVALINFYAPEARMGMHRDAEEVSPAPVVSISLGDTAVFRFGNTAGRGWPWRDVHLDSGDVFVFGGPSRRAFHGVTRILPGTGPADIGVGVGRWNLTIRQTGLAVPGYAGLPDSGPGPGRQGR
ncbi:alkylated DNA repair protein (DNA oxidative demethylase) [Stackebrandtia albiflava]|uniref:Alkylated DNA repair protein (DNA oxidative demethylase) n=1 Tax=Stackebrandtia albiflava TaxID=406432 RepID=A0A562VDQ9_9ACTN|nr:alpha-ketoglutarate-dependent dioxygenase AlkB [Stackebrandtia albiflava]TWJ15951.1 alkylated DNA repair protein (DNA oxidative demethylase) [Stackebrandtia albiflava]